MRRKERDEVARLDPPPRESAKSFLTVTGRVAPFPCCYQPIIGRRLSRVVAFLYADLVGRGGCRLCRLADTELAQLCISRSARLAALAPVY
jgi:hypothetical protein